MASRRIRRGLLLALKIAVSASLIALVATRVNLTEYGTVLSKISPGVVATVLAIIVVQMAIISAYRLKFLLALLSCRISVFRTSCVTWSGFFSEQIGAIFVTGDLVRIWLLRQAGVNSVAAIEGPLLDRIIGFGCLALLATVGFPSLWLRLSENQREIMISCAAVLVLLPLAVLVAARARLNSPKALASLYAAIQSAIGTLARRSSHGTLARVAMLAMMTHGLNIVAIYFLLGGVGAQVSFAHCFYFIPTVLFVSNIPVSISGWGIREAAMLVALHNFNVEPAGIIMASVLFGTCAIVASLPGALIWLSVPNRHESAESTGEARLAASPLQIDSR